eukprot:403370875
MEATRTAKVKVFALATKDFEDVIAPMGYYNPHISNDYEITFFYTSFGYTQDSVQFRDALEEIKREAAKQEYALIYNGVACVTGIFASIVREQYNMTGPTLESYFFFHYKPTVKKLMNSNKFWDEFIRLEDPIDQVLARSMQEKDLGKIFDQVHAGFLLNLPLIAPKEFSSPIDMSHVILSSLATGSEYMYEGYIDKMGEIVVLASGVIYRKNGHVSGVYVRDDVTIEELKDSTFSRQEFNKIRDKVNSFSEYFFGKGFKQGVFEVEAFYDISKDDIYVCEINPRAGCALCLWKEFAGKDLCLAKTQLDLQMGINPTRTAYKNAEKKFTVLTLLVTKNQIGAKTIQQLLNIELLDSLVSKYNCDWVPYFNREKDAEIDERDDQTEYTLGNVSYAYDNFQDVDTFLDEQIPALYQKKK